MLIHLLIEEVSQIIVIELRKIVTNIILTSGLTADQELNDKHEDLGDENMNMDKLKIADSKTGISEEEIDKALKGIDLPQCYLKLIKKVNGFIDEKGIKIYSANEIKERNQTFEVDKYLPGYVAIGDDSGGNLLIMKACSSAKKVYISDSGSLILDESEDVLTCDFEEWIENGCSLLEEKTSGTDSCKVILVRMPKGGAKDLLKIKKIFNCNIPMKEMLLAARNNSLVIAENITVSKANVLIKKLEDAAEFVQIKSN